MITTNRPLYSWPSLVLELVIVTGRPRGLVGEAWLEIHHRAREAADFAVVTNTDDATGPYRVAPPPGMH